MLAIQITTLIDFTPSSLAFNSWSNASSVWMEIERVSSSEIRAKTISNVPSGSSGSTLISFKTNFEALEKVQQKKFASKLCQFSQSPNLLKCNWPYSNDLNIRTSPVSTCPKAIRLSNGLKFKWYLNNWLKKPSHDGFVRFTIERSFCTYLFG